MDFYLVRLFNRLSSILGSDKKEKCLDIKFLSSFIRAEGLRVGA